MTKGIAATLCACGFRKRRDTWKYHKKRSRCSSQLFKAGFSRNWFISCWITAVFRRAVPFRYFEAHVSPIIYVVRAVSLSSPKRVTLPSSPELPLWLRAGKKHIDCRGRPRLLPQLCFFCQVRKAGRRKGARRTSTQQEKMGWDSVS